MVKIIGFYLNDIRTKRLRPSVLRDSPSKSWWFFLGMGKRDVRRQDYQCCILDKVI